jgi:hypothetical protein
MRPWWLLKECGPSGLAACGLTACRLARCALPEGSVDFVEVEAVRVEVTANPFAQFAVTLVSWVCDGLQELAAAPRSADILGRTAPGVLDKAADR